MQKGSATELIACLSGIYAAKGAPTEVAQTVAELQVEASLAGHDSHGVPKLKDYIDRIDRGDIAPQAQPTVLAEGATTAVIDGNWGFGFWVTSKAVQLAMHKAKESGVAAITIRRQSHIGRLGAYTGRLAAQGFIGILTADSGAGPKSAAPFGGREARLGTNPIAISFPAIASSVCLDMATTAVALGKVSLAARLGQPIPEGWVLDASGRPTTSAKDYFTGGSLLPLGADQGYKGYGLSFVVETLSGLLTGLGFGIDPSGRHNDGCFLAAFDVSRFRPLEDFKREMEEFIAFVKSSAPATGFTEVLYPGELEARSRVVREASGIPVDDQTWEYLTAQAITLGVTPPCALV